MFFKQYLIFFETTLLKQFNDRQYQILQTHRIHQFQFGEMQITYAGDMTQSKIDYVLNKLSPYCESCGGKKMYFCIERCCKGFNSFLCLECDEEHKLHRKNELKLLFLNHKLLKPHSVIVKDSISYLSNLLRQQKRRCQQLIQKQVCVAKLYAKAMKEIQDCLPRQQQEWLEKAYSVVQKVLQETKPNKQTRQEFTTFMHKFNLYPKCPFTYLRAFRTLIEALQEYHDNPLKLIQNSQKSVLSTLQNFQQDIPQTTEAFVRRTNIQKFITYNPEQLDSIVSNGLNRSKCVYNRNITPKQLDVSRVIVDCNWQAKQRFDCSFGDQVTQLHTRLNVTKLPSKLKALSFWAWDNDRTQPKKDMSQFPTTLTTLKILQDLSDQSKQMPYKLSHLTNLKYLVVVDNFLTPQIKKSLVKFAIRNQLRMMCLNKGTLRQNYQKTTNRSCKLEAVYLHEHTALERHYIVYKRKQLQATLLQRKTALRKCFYTEDILNFAKCQLQYELEKEFDKSS